MGIRGDGLNRESSQAEKAAVGAWGETLLSERCGREKAGHLSRGGRQKNSLP